MRILLYISATFEGKLINQINNYLKMKHYCIDMYCVKYYMTRLHPKKPGKDADIAGFWIEVDFV